MHDPSLTFTDSLGEKRCWGYFRYPQSNSMSSNVLVQNTYILFVELFLRSVYYLSSLVGRFPTLTCF